MPKKKPTAKENQRVLWTGCDLDSYEGRVVKIHDTVSGPILDLDITVISPFSGQPNYYKQYGVPYSPKPAANSWRPYPKDE
jgi:hypothetical protein